MKPKDLDFIVDHERDSTKDNPLVDFYFPYAGGTDMLPKIENLHLCPDSRQVVTHKI